MTRDELKDVAYQTLTNWINQGLSPADAGEAVCYLHALVWVNSKTTCTDAESMLEAHKALFMDVIETVERPETLQ